MRGKSVCYWHDPERAEDVADARRLGGLHRRKAASVATIYDFAGLRSIEGAQRLLETAALETFALENSVPRNRTLISAAAGAAQLIEVGDHEERIRALEATPAGVARLVGGDRRLPGHRLVTAERRLRAVEASLTPTQLVLRWLDEAHAFGDVESYVRSQLAESSVEGPLDRLAREVARGARASLRGKRPEIIDTAIRSALRETVFRFDLVMRILVTTHELLEREGLIEAALSAHLALLTSEGRAERRRDTTYLKRFATLRGLLLFRVAGLRAAHEARSAVEERYLAGHTALFPDAVKAWDEQLRNTQTLADVTCRLAALDGVPPAEPPDHPEAISARVTGLVSDLVEPAKTTALEKLGEGEQAQGIAIGWLRPKLLLVTSA